MSWFTPTSLPVPTPISSGFPYSTKWEAFWEIFKSFIVYILIAIFVIWIAYSYSKNGMDKKLMGGCRCSKL